MRVFEEVKNEILSLGMGYDQYQWEVLGEPMILSKFTMDLAEMLAEDEKVLAICHNSETGLLINTKVHFLFVSTTDRIIIMKRGLTTSKTSDIIAYSDIEKYEESMKRFFSVLRIYIKKMKKYIELNGTAENISHIARILESRKGETVIQKNVVPSIATTTSSVAEELIKLKTLLDQGVLTEEEFAELKKKLI